MVTGQGHRGQITAKKLFLYFYAVSSITQKAADRCWWAFAGWCRMIKGRLSSIVRKIGKWSRSQRSNNHSKGQSFSIKHYISNFCPILISFGRVNQYVFRICLPLWWRFALFECLLVFYAIIRLIRSYTRVVVIKVCPSNSVGLDY